MGLLQQPDLTSQTGISEAEAVDIHGRFRIWAGNVGAFQNSDIKSSLDYRLRDAPKIATQIIELLDELAESLDDGMSFPVSLFLCIRLKSSN